MTDSTTGTPDEESQELLSSLDGQELPTRGARVTKFTESTRHPATDAPDAGDREQLQVVSRRTGAFGAPGTGDTSGFGGLVSELREDPPTERPLPGWFEDVVEVLEELIVDAGFKVADVIEKPVVDRDQLTLYIAAKHLPMVARMVRDDQDLRFELGIGVSGAHYPQFEGRELHAVYSLFSVTHSRQLQLEVACSDAHPHIPSVVGIYPGMDWHERETWDLMGIVFDGHPGLTRTAMPDDWVGHPQRKDYPLGGIPVEYKGATVPPPDTRRSYR